jgi:hypothetical protein
MEQGIPTSDREIDSNIPDIPAVLDPPGADGSLEPFIMAHNAHFVSLLMAGEFRRGRARAAAVGYGTSTGSGIPLSSASIEELSFYYNHLVKQAEADDKSEEIYEKFEIKRLDVESLSYRLRHEDLPLEEKQQLLNELTDLMGEIELLTAEMENLGSA